MSDPLDGIVIRVDPSGMAFATREAEPPVFLAQTSLEKLHKLLPAAIRRATDEGKTDE